MKQCFKCMETKPISDFYRHPGTVDGRLNKCMVCARKDEKDRYYKKLALGAATDDRIRSQSCLMIN